MGQSKTEFEQKRSSIKDWIWAKKDHQQNLWWRTDKGSIKNWSGAKKEKKVIRIYLSNASPLEKILATPLVTMIINTPIIVNVDRVWWDVGVTWNKTCYSLEFSSRCTVMKSVGVRCAYYALLRMTDSRCVLEGNYKIIYVLWNVL